MIEDDTIIVNDQINDKIWKIIVKEWQNEWQNVKNMKNNKFKWRRQSQNTGTKWLENSFFSVSVVVIYIANPRRGWSQSDAW